MELMRLSQPSYRFEESITGYKSLLWVERYRDAGEFELKTADIEVTMNQMPLGSLVSLLQTNEVMFVETHNISHDDNGEAILTVQGRSFETFFENRIAVDYDYLFYDDFDYSDPANPKVTNTHNWAVSLSNSNEFDMARHIISVMCTQEIDPEELDTNKIPNFNVTNSVTRGRRNIVRYMERGSLYDAVIATLEEVDGGIRTRRPTEFISDLRTEIYEGAWRTPDWPLNVPTVILDVKLGHLSDVEYLYSVKDYYNTIYLYPKHRRRESNVSKVGSGVPARPGMSGLGKRARLVDATEINGVTFDETYDAIKGRWGTELTKMKPVRLMSCKASKNIPYAYGVEYNLGDVLRVRGLYGMQEDLRVTEYVRNEDEHGEEAYPVLESPKTT